MADKYDVIVIGGGPAGYVAAIRCAQLGMKTAVVDAGIGADGKPVLGGTCLNVGCIPSKALLDISEQFHRLQHGVGDYGIRADGVDIDIAKMMARKQAVVTQLTQGISSLFKANKIDWLPGYGTLLPERQVRVKPLKGKAKTLKAGHVILASGSKPVDIAAAPVNGEQIVDSTGALSFTRVPKRLAVIGAGVIGLELGSVWNRLGAEVVLLEAQSEFLAMADPMVAREAQRQFKRQGLDIRLGARVCSSKVKKDAVTLSYEDGDGEQTLEADRVLVAVGRTPNTEGLLAEETGLTLDECGFVAVDAQCRTNLDGVFAIGDVVRGPMLAHKGSEEGVAVAEIIAGQGTPISHDHIPWVMYTDPEIAWVGRSETMLKNAGVDYRAGMFPFAATGRALAMDATAGFVKILADAQTDRLLGVHVIGRNASELIAEAVLAMEFDATAEDLARTVHAHPTLSEAMHEAALDVDGRAIHKVSRKGR